MTLRFTTTAQGEVITLAISGRIDASTANEFHRAIAEALELGPQLVIDLTAVDLLASAGVAVLYDYVDRNPQLLVRPGSVIATVLTIAGLDEKLPHRAT